MIRCSLGRPKQRWYIFLTIWCIGLKISSTLVIRCHIRISWWNWIDIRNVSRMWLIYHISHLSDRALYMIILSFDWWAIADDSVRHPNLHLFAISLNLTISFNESIGLFQSLFELHRKFLVLHLTSNSFYDVSHEKCLLLRSWVPMRIRDNDLKGRPLRSGMILRKILIQPHFYSSFIIDADHPVSDFKRSHLIVALLEASQWFTQHIDRLRKGQKW